MGNKALGDDGDKEILLEQIIRAREKFGIDIIAYSIASNHYHLFAHCDSSAQMTKTLQGINGASSRFINLRNNRNGSIWFAASKHSCVVQGREEYFKVLAYIIGNPLKHGLARDFIELANYKYCSYNEAVKEYGKEMADNLIMQNQKFDFETPEAWIRLHQSLKNGFAD
ncbi:MAG: transposase [Parcubacteria group bacterium]